MKANERKQLEKNELADKLRNAWDTVAGSSPRGNKIWAVVLVVLAGALAWTLYSKFSARSDAALWAQLDTAGDIDSLEAVIKEAPKSTQAAIARFHLARARFLDATRKLADDSPDERGRSADSLEKVRDDYLQYKGDTQLPPVLQQEAMVQCAKAEEILASVPKGDDLNAMRGSLSQALEYYNELNSKYPDCFYAKYAQERAKDLRDHKSEIEAVNKELAKAHAKNPPAPVIPSLPAGVTPQPPTGTGSGAPLTSPPPSTNNPPVPVPAPPVEKTPEAPAKSPESAPKAPETSKTPPQ